MPITDAHQLARQLGLGLQDRGDHTVHIYDHGKMVYEREAMRRMVNAGVDVTIKADDHSTKMDSLITDLAAGLQGGLGMAASANLHPSRTSMFEPVHGSAPPIAGKNIANPFGAILTAAMMLAHLGMGVQAEKIEGAVLEAVRQKKTTADIRGSLGTREAGEWVANQVSRR